MSIVESKLETFKSSKQIMDYLSQAYPSLYLYILEHLKMTDEIEQYMAMCKEYENDHEKFSLYVHGYFLPWLHQ